MSKRTILDFETDKDIWEIVNEWSQGSHYRLKEEKEDYRLMQKGYGLLVAPMMLEIKKDGNKVHMEAWIRVPMVTRIFALFLLPAELDLGKGMRAVAPRTVARNSVNKLLIKLEQEEIK